MPGTSVGAIVSVAVATVGLASALTTPAPSAQTPSPSEPLRIHGEVRVEGGAVLEGARITTDALRGPQAQQIAAAKRFQALTGADGKFALIGPTRGLWILEVRARDHLPHVAVLPIFMMIPQESHPWETGLALLPTAAVLSPDVVAGAPEHVVIEAVTHAANGDRAVALRALRRLEGASLHAGSLVAAGDAALLIRDAARARQFFEAARKAAPGWYRPHLGIASAAMLAFDVDRAIAAYGEARAVSPSAALTGSLSLAIRDLQQIATKGRGAIPPSPAGGAERP